MSRQVKAFSAWKEIVVRGVEKETEIEVIFHARDLS